VLPTRAALVLALTLLTQLWLGVGALPLDEAALVRAVAREGLAASAHVAAGPIREPAPIAVLGRLDRLPLPAVDGERRTAGPLRMHGGVDSAPAVTLARPDAAGRAEDDARTPALRRALAVAVPGRAPPAFLTRR